MASWSREQSRHVRAGAQCDEWSRLTTSSNRAAAPRRTKKGSRPVKTETHSILTARVNEVEITPTAWMAATSAGFYTSSNQGKSWSGGPVMGKQDFVSVQSNGNLIALATRSTFWFQLTTAKAARLQHVFLRE